MEIQRLMNEYRKHSPKEFFDWLSKDKTIEVRFLSDFRGNKFSNWDLLRTLANKFDLPYRFNSLFIDSYEDLKNILLFKMQNYPLTRLYNIFIGVNPKRRIPLKNKNGLVFKGHQGSIAGTSHIQTILCDIEHKQDRTNNATEAELEECVQAAKHLVKVLELESYWINISGNGTHLWFDLDEPIELPIPNYVELDTRIKYKMKEEPIVTLVKTYNRFIMKLDKMLQKFNPKLKVDDGAKDIARIARAPGSWNVKPGKTQRCVGTVVKNISNIKYNYNKFMAAKPIVTKVARKAIKISEISKNHRYNKLNIRDSPIYQLLISQMLPSTLSRNHYLEQSFAYLLRDNDIHPLDIPDVIYEIDNVQNKSIQVDPDYLEDDKVFNPEMINTFCFACKLPFVYDVLEDTPEVQENDIVNPFWDKISFSSIGSLFKMQSTRMESFKKPNDYIELKSFIRQIIDRDINRQTVFFICKCLYQKEWDYYKEPIIKIMNKTRRRLE